MQESCTHDYILSGSRFKKEYLLMISHTKEPDLVLKFVEHTRSLLTYVGCYPDVVLKKLRQHLNINKPFFENDQLASALTLSWTYHAIALCFYKVQDYQSAFDTLSAALINDCDIYVSHKIALIVDSVFMLSSRLLDMSLIDQSFEKQNNSLKDNFLKSLSSGILNICNHSIDISNYIKTTEQSNALLYAYPMNRIFFQDIMSSMSIANSDPLIIDNIKNYTQFLEFYTGTKSVTENKQLVTNDSLRIATELSEIINLDCLIDIKKLKLNQLKVNSYANIRLYCSSRKSYFVSANELKFLNTLSHA